MAKQNVTPITTTNTPSAGEKSARQAAVEDAAYEFVFAVVGHVGSGTSEVAKQLEDKLHSAEIGGITVDVQIIKARTIIEDWVKEQGDEIPNLEGLKLVEWYQNMGDNMRKQNNDFTAIARGFALKIREIRAQKTGKKIEGDEPVLPDGKPRAYILDSIRHPDEVKLLRHIYRDAFVLIGVVCQENIRLERLKSHYKDAGEKNARDLMLRDAKAKDKHGQRTGDAFHMADFFIDNSVNRIVEKGGQPTSNEDWKIPDHLKRLVKILSHELIVRPTIDETGMHHAYSAQMRSACLSRQVGAALLSKDGDVLATGTNEVPKASGGVYGEIVREGEVSQEEGDDNDHRCAFRNDKYCSNTREQNEIIYKILADLDPVIDVKEENREKLFEILKNGRIGSLIEFSRAVHAEMDAILSAARAAKQIKGSHLYVTTFPCHYCARHIITAGIDKVLFIEPYPKSAALKLHKDAIQTEWVGWEAPSDGGVKVLFRPFSGVAPRMYRRAFQKTRDLKDDRSGDLKIYEPEWANPWHLGKSSYVTLEAKLLESN